MNTIDEFDHYLVGAICFNDYFFYNLEDSINSLYYKFNCQFSKEHIRSRIDEHNKNPQLFLNRVQYLNDKKIKFPWDNENKQNVDKFTGTIYVIDEIVLEINNLIFFNQINYVEELSNTLLKFLGYCFDRYMVGTRYIESINKWFVFITEYINKSNKLLCLFLSDSKINLNDFSNSMTKTNYEWYSTDEKCSSVKSLDYLYCNVEKDYDLTKFLNSPKIQTILFILDNRLVLGNNLIKIKHNARLCVGDYGLNSEYRKIETDALELLTITGNFNAKHALKRYYK